LYDIIAGLSQAILDKLMRIKFYLDSSRSVTRSIITRRGIIREREINFYFRIKNSIPIIKMVILNANHDWEVS
jgi:hypothetical protein